MSDQTTPPSTGSGDTDVAALDSGQGRTTIADVVVAKIAGIAAREISGVHDLGGGAARAVGALRERIGGPVSAGGSSTQGVSVEVGERQAAIDLQLVAHLPARRTLRVSPSTASRSPTWPRTSARTSSRPSSG